MIADVAERLQEAATLADRDPGGAAVVAMAAVGLLTSPERQDVLVLAASLFRTAGRYGEAGEAFRLAGKWIEAEAALGRAYAAEPSAVTANNLAMIYKYIGQFDRAEALYRRALSMAPDDPSICHNLGGLAHARGASAEGLVWARRAVELRPDNPADQGALAALLIELGEYEEARELLTRCRETFVRQLGEHHHEVGVTDGNLAALALAEGDLAGAEECARRALAVKERNLGLTHPELAPTLTTLGVIRRRCGDAVEAAALHRRALAVLEPADHPLAQRIRANLAQI